MNRTIVDLIVLLKVKYYCCAHNTSEFDSLDNLCMSVLFLEAMDLTYGAVMCMVCGDYVYDRDIEEIFRKQQRKSAKLLGKLWIMWLWIM